MTDEVVGCAQCGQVLPMVRPANKRFCSVRCRVKFWRLARWDRVMVEDWQRARERFAEMGAAGAVGCRPRRGVPRTAKPR